MVAGSMPHALRSWRVGLAASRMPHPALPAAARLHPCAVLGCLKDALFELHEGVEWGLLEPGFEAQQRQQARSCLPPGTVPRCSRRLLVERQACASHAHPLCPLHGPAFQSRPAPQLLNAAANELHSDKRLVVELAREHRLADRYAAEVKARGKMASWAGGGWCMGAAAQ